MTITVGTFNLNNLFSRFNFSAVIEQLQDDGAAMGALTIRYEFTDPENIRIRTFRGRLVRGKNPASTIEIAERIRNIDVDVLAVQEVEHVEILKKFNRDYLDSLYPNVVLVEGNDNRFIDVGVLSKLPIGAITSHQSAIHPSVPDQRVFGRDLLEVEILNPNRSRKLFKIYNNHLKSNFVHFTQDPAVVGPQNNQRRLRQAETIAEIVAARERPDSRYIILGDMNDRPDSEFLLPMRTIEGQSLLNALANPSETRPPKRETEGPGPQSPAWTFRRNPPDGPPEHLLLDQIWLSSALAGRLAGAFIDRRTKHGGDGSDHDPAWVELDV